MECERVVRSACIVASNWNTKRSIPYALLLYTFYAVIQGMGLKFVQMDVPGALHKGDSSWLVCDYDLGEDELYSVKWYKNNLEFFRYLPSDDPPAQKYDLLGVYVDLKQSNSTHVFLYKTDLNTEGTYGCEVSTEAPSFRTVKADKELRIYVIPNEGPDIEGLDPPYKIGDNVNITCTSGPSKPFSHMKWFVNGVEVWPTSEYRYPPMRHSNGLQTTVIGLDFIIDYTHFWGEKISIKCTSSIPQVYSSASEEVVIGDRSTSAKPYHVSHKASDQKGPTIKGNQPWYDVGDLVNINCTSARTAIPAHIRWVVNGMEPKREHVIKYPTIRYSDGTEISNLGLRMKVQHHHFRSDELRIKCTSTLYRMITREADAFLLSSPGNHVFFQYLPNGVGISACSYCKTVVLIMVVLSKERLLQRISFR